MPHERFYGLAAKELAERRFDQDLFAMVYANAGGDAAKAKALYIKTRAERLEKDAAAAERLRVERERAEKAPAAQFEEAGRREEIRTQALLEKMEKERLAKEVMAVKQREIHEILMEPTTAKEAAILALDDAQLDEVIGRLPGDSNLSIFARKERQRRWYG